MSSGWQLTWGGSKLFVAGGHTDDDSLMHQLSDFYLSIMALKRFSGSRWLTVGRACRSLSLMRLLGLDALVKAILEDRGGDYYMSPCTQLW